MDDPLWLHLIGNDGGDIRRREKCDRPRYQSTFLEQSFFSFHIYMFHARFYLGMWLC
jgi:hypothetical protein